MRELYAYIAIKGDLYSTAIVENNEILSHKTAYKRAEDKNINIRTMKSLLSSLKIYIGNDDCLVYFITPNNYIEKWIRDGYAKQDIKDEFDELMELFQSIPIKYKFLNNVNNKATQYLKDDCIVKVVLDSSSSLLDEFNED